MFIYDSEIEYSNVSSEDKNTLKNFFELLDNYKNRLDEFPEYTNEELSHIFQIAKISPRLQIEMWRRLPGNIVNNPVNIEIFEGVLDNKFGEYINGIDKRAFVKILNGSRGENRCYG